MTKINQIEKFEILQQLREGSHYAFEKIYFKYSKRLYWKLHNLIHDEDQADELLQDLFVKVWERRQQIDVEQPFEAYLHRIAQRMAVDYFRQLERQSRLYDSFKATTSELTLNTEELLAANETQRILSAAIALLPEQRRKAFTLCKLEGRSHKEAAEIMNISPNTLHNHLVKAVSFLKEHLEKSGCELSPLVLMLAILGV